MTIPTFKPTNTNDNPVCLRNKEYVEILHNDVLYKALPCHPDNAHCIVEIYGTAIHFCVVAYQPSFADMTLDELVSGLPTWRECSGFKK